MVMIQIFVELKFSANVTELDGSGSLSSARRIEKQGQPLADDSLGGFPYHIVFGLPNVIYRILFLPGFSVTR